MPEEMTPDIQTNADSSLMEPEVEDSPVEVEETAEETPQVEVPAEPSFEEKLLQRIDMLEAKLRQPVETKAQAVEAAPTIEELQQKYPEINEDARFVYEDALNNEVNNQVLRAGGYDALTADEVAEIEQKAQAKAAARATAYFKKEVAREEKLMAAIPRQTDPLEEKAMAIASVVPEYAEYLNSRDPKIRAMGIKLAAATYDKAYGTGSPAPTPRPVKAVAHTYTPPKSGKRVSTPGTLQVDPEILAQARRMFPENYSTPEKAARTEAHIIEMIRKRGRK